MGKIESLGNVLTNPRKEPKPMNAGIWKKNGKIEWAAKSRNMGMPEEMKGKITSLFLRTPEDIDIQGYVDAPYSYKGRDIVEVRFSGKGGKPDDIRILETDAPACFSGKEEKKRAKSTKEQITDLIAEKGEQPEDIYWQRDVTKVHGDKKTSEHIEITFPYTDIEIEIKHITNGGDPVVLRGIGVNADIRDKGVESMEIGRARAYKIKPEKIQADRKI